MTAIFFIPEAGITPYLRALCIIASALKNQGHKIYFTCCTGEMVRCPMLTMHKIAPNVSSVEKAKICAKCFSNINTINEKYGFDLIPLKGVVSAEVLMKVNMLEITNPNTLDDITFDDFAVGKMAQYDFGLEKKQIYSIKLDSSCKELFLAYVKNTALAMAIGEELYKRFSPDVFVSFNQYAQSDGIRYIATKYQKLNFNVTYPINLGFDGSLLYISKHRFFCYENNRCQEWSLYKGLPITKKMVMASWNDTLYRNYQSNSHIYTQSKNTGPVNLKNMLNLATNRKTIVAYTSSGDEILGGEMMLNVWHENPVREYAFPDQISWLKFLKAYVQERDDIQIVVRIHPREGVNKNYSFGSSHLELLRGEFKDSTENFIIVWPEDKISSYDLFELAHGVLVAWSSMALEASRVGIPALTYAKNMCYPDADFIMVATTIEEYKRKLELLISTEYQFDYLIKAIRFNHLRTFLPCIDIGETVSNDPFDHLWPSSPPKLEKAIVSILNDEIDIVVYNKKKWLEMLSANAEIQEKDAICFGIRMFIDNTYFPPKIASINLIIIKCLKKISLILQKLGFSGFAINRKVASLKYKDYLLKYSSHENRIEEFKKQTIKNKNIRILVGNSHGQTWYIVNGNAIARFSPLCFKLSKLAGTQN